MPPRQQANRTFTVQQPKRLLPWMVQQTRTPHSQASRLIKAGAITVNGEVIRAGDHRLSPRDTVVIHAEGSAAGPSPPFPVLFEDEHLVIIDKPAGLLSVATDSERERTAHRLLGGNARVHVVHRIDRETSGILVFAKSVEVKDQLQAHWDEVTKEYLAVVDGVPPRVKDTLVDWLREDPAGLKVHVVSTEKDAKRAVTHYHVLSSRGGRSLLQLRIETGRKHQIRAQLAHAGFPVCGDDRYGTGKPAPRLALHAARVRFNHPVTGAVVAVECRLPSVLAKLAGAPSR